MLLSILHSFTVLLCSHFAAAPSCDNKALHQTAAVVAHAAAAAAHGVRPGVSQGADVNESDARGITAIGLAVGYNKVALVKVLLDGGADVSKTDAKGSTVLHYAAGNVNYQKSRLRRCVHV